MDQETRKREMVNVQPFLLLGSNVSTLLLERTLRRLLARTSTCVFHVQDVVAFLAPDSTPKTVESDRCLRTLTSHSPRQSRPDAAMVSDLIPHRGADRQQSV